MLLWETEIMLEPTFFARECDHLLKSLDHFEADLSALETEMSAERGTFARDEAEAEEVLARFCKFTREQQSQRVTRFFENTPRHNSTSAMANMITEIQNRVEAETVKTAGGTWDSSPRF